ncbi:MAG TPA: type II CAAX endopeptidase family protein [Longimicrobiales bacterium]
MAEDQSPVRARSGPAAIAIAWANALARLLVFGMLFVALVEIIGLLTFTILPRGEWGFVANGAIWLVAALVASIIPLKAFDGRSWRALGIAPTRDALRQSALGLGLGVAMIVVAVALMLATNDLTFGSDSGTFGEAAAITLGSLAALFLPAAAEEAIFRGYPIQVLARTAGAPLAILTTSAAFAAVHGDNPAVGPLALTNIFLAGVLLGVVYLKTASLWAATAVHLGWNWAMAGLFDLPVSGLGWIDVPRFEPWVVGPAWWNGGAFGPEGGVIGTICFVGATVLVLRSKRFHRDPETGAGARMLHEPEAV